MPEYWNNGKLEDWVKNWKKIEEKNETQGFEFFGLPIIPLFHHSNFPTFHSF